MALMAPLALPRVSILTSPEASILEFLPIIISESTSLTIAPPKSVVSPSSPMVYSPTVAATESSSKSRVLSAVEVTVMFLPFKLTPSPKVTDAELFFTIYPSEKSLAVNVISPAVCPAAAEASMEELFSKRMSFAVKETLPEAAPAFEVEIVFPSLRVMELSAVKL